MPTPQETTTTSGSVAVSAPIINNNVTVVVAAPPAPALRTHPHPHPHPHPRGNPGAPRVNSPTGIPGGGQPEVHYDAHGDKVTTYTGRDGATATFTDHVVGGVHHVTFSLHDRNGTVITQSDNRGYSASTVDIQGMQTARPGYTELFGALSGDRLNCPGTGARHITPGVDEQVTRTQLQDFFAQGRHADLLAQVRGVNLPVTVVGGMPASLAQALSTGSDYRGCPPLRRGEGIIVERIPH